MTPIKKFSCLALKIHKFVFYRLREPDKEDAGPGADEAVHDTPDKEAQVDGRSHGLGQDGPTLYRVAFHAGAKRADSQAHAQPWHRRRTYTRGIFLPKNGTFLIAYSRFVSNLVLSLNHKFFCRLIEMRIYNLSITRMTNLGLLFLHKFLVCFNEDKK